MRKMLIPLLILALVLLCSCADRKGETPGVPQNDSLGISQANQTGTSQTDRPGDTQRTAQEETPEQTKDPLREELQRLVDDLGVFASPQSGTAQGTADRWLKPGGVLAASIDDFDADGEDEMLVFCSEPTQASGNAQQGADPHEIAVLLYENRDGAAALSDRKRLCGLSAAPEGTLDLQVTLMRTETGCRLLCECGEEAYDCLNERYWIVACGDKLEDIASFDGTDYSFVTYEGSIYQSGELVEKSLWFGDADYVDMTGEQSLYDSFPDAVTAFFNRFGVQLEDVEHMDYYRYTGAGLFAGTGRESLLSIYIGRDSIGESNWFTAVNESAITVSELLYPMPDDNTASLLRTMTGMWCHPGNESHYVLELREDGSCEYMAIYDTSVEANFGYTGNFTDYYGTYRVVGENGASLDIGLALYVDWVDESDEPVMRTMYIGRKLWRLEPLSSDVIRIVNLGRQTEGIESDGANFYSTHREASGGFTIDSETWGNERKLQKEKEAEYLKRIVRIAENYCLTDGGIDTDEHLQIRDPFLEKGKYHVCAYLPSNIGPKIFLEFIFETDMEAEIATVDDWGETTTIRIADYD